MTGSFDCAGVMQQIRSNPTVLENRPIAPRTLQYMSADVSHLPLLADKLASDLGAAELRILPKLSMAYSQWQWDAADRDGARPDRYGSMTASRMISRDTKG